MPFTRPNTSEPLPARLLGSPWGVAELARHLQISDRHLRRMIADLRVRSIRLGRRVLIPDDEAQRLAREGV